MSKLEAYRDLPGFELVTAGLADLEAGRESVESLLLRSAAGRLAALGVPVPTTGPTDAASRMYWLLYDQVGEGRAHGRYNALRRRLVSFLKSDASRMRRPIDAGRLTRFLVALGRAGSGYVTAYLVGDASAVLVGWRRTTISIDLHLEPEREELLGLVPALKEQHEVNVVLASPLDFLPELPGWRDRSPFVRQEGPLTVRHFEFHAQALSKLDRGFDQDTLDVNAMLERDLVSVAELERLLEAIADDLYRFPTVDADALRASVRGLS